MSSVMTETTCLVMAAMPLASLNPAGNVPGGELRATKGAETGTETGKLIQPRETLSLRAILAHLR